MATYEYITELVDLSQEEFPGTASWVVLQTRPLTLGNSLNKRLDCLISRANIENKENEFSVQMLAGSNDLKTWRVVSYVHYGGDVSKLKSKFPTSNYKYYILMIAGEREGFELTQMDVEFNTMFTNKLR